MHTPLRVVGGERQFVFVVGKGGVGKTTTAGALALALADDGESVHLISTDPAHSTGDLFGIAASGPGDRPCVPGLRVEAFDATAYSKEWAVRARPQLAALLVHGTWLDDDEVDHVVDAALPGIDEVMAALRLTELAGTGARVVVDTAPAGHTLRLLDAGAVITTWIEPLRAMAVKASVVASRMTGVPARLTAEQLLDDLDAAVARYTDVLGGAAFIVVERAEPVVQAETDRLIAALSERALRVAAVVRVGEGPDRPGFVTVALPLLQAIDDAEPCAALRTLALEATTSGLAPAADSGHDAGGRGFDRDIERFGPENAGTGRATTAADVPADARHAGGRGVGSTVRSEPGATPIAGAVARCAMVLFAGKGGVGKSTCAAAAAVALADDGPVLLVGTDPAGSLGDVLRVQVGREATDIGGNLRARQIDAAAELAAAREHHRADIEAVFARMGLDRAATLDRAVIESLWDLAPSGVDEVIALIELAALAGTDETVIVDAAPTGHFLRLLEMPELVRGWTTATMRLLLRHGAAASLDAVAARVMDFSKGLRALQSKLIDPARTRAFVVTLDEPVVLAETGRLRAALEATGIAIAGLIVNRARALDPERLGELALGAPLFAAPEAPAPPAGLAALRAFHASWERVA